MSMVSIITLEELKIIRDVWSTENAKVAFVPTMGALHEGHLSLVKKAKELADRVIVSIFVNPAQFGPNEDFDKYPRTFESDVELLNKLEVDAVFLPNAVDIYPEGYQTYVNNSELSKILCGKSRKGHFQGVLTVVLKLFNLVKPQCAVFGKKDYQQWKLIEMMVRDLALDVEIVGHEIIREADGLALSSRNRYLDADERELALHLSKGLRSTASSLKQGVNAKEDLINTFLSEIPKDPRVRLEYVEILSQKDFSIIENKVEEPCVMVTALYVGDVRLIDNMEMELK